MMSMCHIDTYSFTAFTEVHLFNLHSMKGEISQLDIRGIECTQSLLEYEASKYDSFFRNIIC